VPYVERHLGTEVLPKSQMIGFLRANADDVFLHRWKLIGADKNIKKSNNCLQLTAAYKVRQVLLRSSVIFTLILLQGAICEQQQQLGAGVK